MRGISLILLVVGFVFPAALWAELVGRVTSTKGVAVEQARVRVEPGGETVFSDSNGRFRLTVEPPVELVVSHARFKEGSVTVGATFDRDVLSIVLCAALLAGAAVDSFAAGAGGALLVFGAAMAVRLALGLAMWLKEFVGRPPDRRAEDARKRDAGWWLRRSVGGVTDHALYVTLLAASWAAQFFWQFFVFYHSVLAVILGAYLLVLHRENSCSRTDQS